MIICNPSSPTQTVSQREKKAKLQEKRKAQMAARLEKVRQRKQLKPPAVEEKDDEEEEGKLVVEGERREEDPLAAMIESELGKAREKAEKGGGEERDGGVAKKPYVRPWDKGKSEFKT